MASRPEEFARYRQKMNERILSVDNQVVRRFFALDKHTYADSEHLSAQTKELLGLVASLVLRCDDCVSYHLAQSRKQGLSPAQIFEAMSVGLVVGGSIEERILAMQQRKAALAAAILTESDGGDAGFGDRDLAELFAPLPARRRRA